MRRTTLCVIVCIAASFASAEELPSTGPTSKPTAGLIGPVGARPDAKVVKTLVIDKPGVYENFIVDAEWAEADAVRVLADGVTLRNCEIRNGRHDGIEVYASDVTIENCSIHHFLNGSFKDQKDAHGITGRPTRLTVRNCEIGQVSGDCIQFDPGRGKWGEVTIEHCRLYAEPLKADAADFKKGESPGENAVDTKQKPANPRSKLTIEHCLVQGFSKNGFISNRAAFNLKNYVEVTVRDCDFADNEISLRLRGPGKSDLGGALVTVTDCTFTKTDVAIRVEDQIEKAMIDRPRFGQDVKQRVKHVGGVSKGFSMTGEVEEK